MTRVCVKLSIVVDLTLRVTSEHQDEVVFAKAIQLKLMPISFLYNLITFLSRFIQQ